MVELVVACIAGVAVLGFLLHAISPQYRRTLRNSVRGAKYRITTWKPLPPVTISTIVRERRGVEQGELVAGLGLAQNELARRKEILPASARLRVSTANHPTWNARQPVLTAPSFPSSVDRGRLMATRWIPASHYSSTRRHA